MMTNTNTDGTKRQITIVLDGSTAYHVGFNQSNGSDFRNFVSRGTEAGMIADAARLYPSETCDVTILRTSHRAWLKAAKAARK